MQEIQQRSTIPATTADTYDQLAAYMSSAVTPTIIDPDGSSEQASAQAQTQTPTVTVLCAACGDEWPCEASEIELQAPGVSAFGALHRPEVYDALYLTNFRSARIF